MKLCTYFGNPWIGIYAKTNDKIALIPKDANEKFEQIIAENLKVEVHKALINGSNILGIYTSMNSNGIILPSFVHEEELKDIKKTGLNICVSSENRNAHGNNIVANDKGGIINPYVPNHEKKKMEDALGIELVGALASGYSTVGSACLATNKGFLTHFNTTDEEMKIIEDALKTKGNRGSVNFGTGFIPLGAIVNNHGYIAGEKTTAFELGNIEASFGFVK
ncbi:MAG: translation initiation factor IF-6 [Candidatus Micrarchaeota archaeon]